MDLPMLFRYQDQLNRRIRKVRGLKGGPRSIGMKVLVFSFSPLDCTIFGTV